MTREIKVQAVSAEQVDLVVPLALAVSADGQEYLALVGGPALVVSLVLPVLAVSQAGPVYQDSVGSLAHRDLVAGQA